MTAPYVIWVEFDITDAGRSEFLDLVRANAEASVRLEPGCRRFDVLEPHAGGSIALYEIYDSEAAFRDHLATAHFRDFDTLSAPLVTRKQVRAFAIHENAK